MVLRLFSGPEQYDGVSTKDEAMEYEFLVPKKENLDGSVTLLASLAASSCCSESEDCEIRICEFIPATACVLSRVFSLF